MSNADEPVFDHKESGSIIYKKTSRLVSSIETLLESQPFCILCTQGDGRPYGSLIAFAYAPDLKTFYFTTPAETRKYTLLLGCKHVALVIDNRPQHQDEVYEISAVTITGTALQLKTGPGFTRGLTLLRARHPRLKDFLEAETTALFAIEASSFIYVNRFQEVTRWMP